MWKRLGGSVVQCMLCPNGCQLNEDERRHLPRAAKRSGEPLLTHLFPNSCIHVDPIEKKPMFHFLPGSTGFFHSYCGLQHIVQILPELAALPGKSRGHRRRADHARGPRRTRACIALAGHRLYLQRADRAVRVHPRRVRRCPGPRWRSIIISNGYIMPEAGRMLAASLDAIKIDLKGFTENFYSSICGGRLKPVLDNLVSLRPTVKWLELVILVIPTLNDSPAEIKKMAAWVRTNLSPDVPMQLHPLPRPVPDTEPAAHAVETLERLPAPSRGTRESGTRTSGTCRGTGGRTPSAIHAKR